MDERFGSELDLQWALHHGPWPICGSVLFLERWYEGFDFRSPVQTSVPVWILFPDLPCCLKVRNVAIALASRVGKPILVDSASLGENSSRIPRVKVVCDLADPVVEGSFIEVNGFRVWQRYSYGSFVRPCHKCGIVGHSHLVCPKFEAHPQRGRSRSRRNLSVSTSRVPPASQPIRQVAVEEGGEEGMVEEVTHKLVIHLSGSEEAEVTVEGEAALPPVAGRVEAPVGSPGTDVSSKVPRDEPVDSSDSDGERLVECSLEGKVGAASRTREAAKVVSASRETRRSRFGSESVSAADKFRVAGASEGLRTKSNKSLKATKVAFELQ